MRDLVVDTGDFTATDCNEHSLFDQGEDFEFRQPHVAANENKKVKFIFETG